MSVVSRKTSATIAAMIAMGWVMGCTARPLKPASHHANDTIQLKTIVIDGHTLAYTVAGKGPPVVLLHGFGAQGWMWEHQQEALAPHFTVYTLDLLGHGYSDRPKLEYTPDLFIDSVKGFISTLAINRAAFIGNSMGAGVAMGMALKHPQLTRGIVLISGFPKGVAKKASLPAYRIFLTFKPEILLRIGFYFSGKGFLRSILKALVVDKSLITDDIVDRAYRFRTFPGSAHALFSTRNNLYQWEEQYAPRISEISTPTLVMWGTQDSLFPLTVGEELHQQIPNSTFLPVKDAGHLAMWEKPHETNTAIVEFLSHIN